MFPVIGTVPLSKEVSGNDTPASLLLLQTDSYGGHQIMDRFIEANDVDDDEWNVVFVDCVDNYYDERSWAPVEDDSDPDSPFIGKTPQECHQLLMKLRKDTESEIDTNMFVIMDERSTKDDTVLLVTVERDDGGENEVLAMPTLRATFQVTNTTLALYAVGFSTVEEDEERAENEEDKVFRGR
jgi:hypothetical protein